jgi:hypothetical protein
MSPARGASEHRAPRCQPAAAQAARRHPKRTAIAECETLLRYGFEALRASRALDKTLGHVRAQLTKSAIPRRWRNRASTPCRRGWRLAIPVKDICWCMSHRSCGPTSCSGFTGGLPIERCSLLVNFPLKFTPKSPLSSHHYQVPSIKSSPSKQTHRRRKSTPSQHPCFPRNSRNFQSRL